jgi:Flp pilus assembly protein TadD
VALNDMGQPQQALKILQAAVRRQPYDRDLLSGLAIYSARAGDRNAALSYVKLLRELEPENPTYVRMAAQIEAAR